MPIVQIPALVADRERLDRTSTAERVAEILRDRIIDGSYRPGARLGEQSITVALEVSRNTLRESFRLLARERLLTHKLNRGVFVCEKTGEDVVDIYRVRRLLECAAARAVAAPPDPGSPALLAADRAVADAEDAARGGAWIQVGTADVRFHQAVTALAGSRRADELMATVGAELRLVFHAIPDTRGLHEPYVARNREILTRLRAGDGPAAEGLLADYLHDAEATLLSHLAHQGDRRRP